MQLQLPYISLDKQLLLQSFAEELRSLVSDILVSFEDLRERSKTSDFWRSYYRSSSYLEECEALDSSIFDYNSRRLYVFYKTIRDSHPDWCSMCKESGSRTTLINWQRGHFPSGISGEYLDYLCGNCIKKISLPIFVPSGNMLPAATMLEASFRRMKIVTEHANGRSLVHTEVGSHIPRGFVENEASMAKLKRFGHDISCSWDWGHKRLCIFENP